MLPQPDLLIVIMIVIRLLLLLPSLSIQIEL